MIQPTSKFSPLNPLRVVLGTHVVGPDGRLYQREDLREISQFQAVEDEVLQEQAIRSEQILTLAKMLIVFASALLTYKETKKLLPAAAVAAAGLIFFQPSKL